MKVYRFDKLKIIIGASFAAFAAMMIAVNVYLLVSWADFSRNCLSTDGVIIGISSHYNSSSESTEHDVTVEYVVDGEVYRRSLGYYSSTMKRGQTVTINYDPENPYRIMNAPYLACGILTLFILVFGGAGVGLVISELLNRNIINRLADEDKYIICDNTTERFEVNANVRVNHVYYMQTNFIYHGPEGREYVFSSRPYHPDKNPFLDGQSVTVYVDIEKNPKKYYVSIEK